jgi:Methyltransferase domain
MDCRPSARRDSALLQPARRRAAAVPGRCSYSSRMTLLRRSPRRALLGLLGLLALAHGARAQEEVPFITTPDRVTLAMLQMARVGPRDRLIDLGSGDGRIVITAARLFGTQGLGVEIVPDLVQRSRASAQAAGVGDKASFVEQDLFKTPLDAATVITLYLLPEVNLQLRPRLLELKPGTRIVSHDWDMGDWLPDQTRTLEVPEKAIGREKLSRVHLWVVPARLHGLWCGPQGQRLRVQQQHQQVSARLAHARQRRDVQDEFSLQGGLLGARLHLRGSSGQLAALSLPEGRLRIVQASGHWQRWSGLVLRAPGEAVPCAQPE